METDLTFYVEPTDDWWDAKVGDKLTHLDETITVSSVVDVAKNEESAPLRCLVAARVKS